MLLNGYPICFGPLENHRFWCKDVKTKKGMQNVIPRGYPFHTILNQHEYEEQILSTTGIKNLSQ